MVDVTTAIELQSGLKSNRARKITLCNSFGILFLCDVQQIHVRLKRMSGFTQRVLDGAFGGESS
jgi:hypothetical protein